MLKNITLCTALFYFTFQMNAQFFRGAGLFIGPTTSYNRYKNLLPIDPDFYQHVYPAPSHHSAELISFSVGLFGEFLRFDHIRWQTEFEYCTKGGVERPLLSPLTGERGVATRNAFSYIQWNNFAKIFGNEGQRGIPYIMLGARLEYNMARSITAYEAVTSLVPKIGFSPDAGVGFEFAAPGKWHLFTEVHYNPDAIKLVVSPVVFWQRMWELRIGIIYRPKQKAIDDCNAPRYHGANY